MKIFILYFAIVFACLVESRPQTSGSPNPPGQIVQETERDDSVTNVDGSRKEEITDDEIIRKPDGLLEEVKKDEVITDTGSGNVPGPFRINPGGSRKKIKTDEVINDPSGSKVIKTDEVITDTGSGNVPGPFRINPGGSRK